jgi:hypothetical protein
MFGRNRVIAAATLIGAFAVAIPAASASAAVTPIPIQAGLFPFPGILNLGPTGALGPLGPHGPLGGTSHLPSGWSAFNLGPTGPLGPQGALGTGGPPSTRG